MSSGSLLELILARGSLSVLFQPIFEVTGEGRRLHSVECLVRGPSGSSVEMADILFEYVRRKREEPQVDRVCIAGAFAAVGALPAELPFSVNVHAATLARDPEFVPFLLDAAQAEGIDPRRIVVEIVEHAPQWAGERLGHSLELLRGGGLRVALDDVGLGQSNYRMMIETRPDFFKLDRYFVEGCSEDYYRQAVLESAVHLARKLGAQAIAEGVERESDLATVGALGIQLIQGFLFLPAVQASEILKLGCGRA
jgi:EAL domain-containing protein (putative c-di-GMP-specific phosphodiesterase class I)